MRWAALFLVGCWGCWSSSTPAPPPANRAPPTASAPKESRASSTCDEVTCVLNGLEGACCAKFKKHQVPTPAQASLPATLDRAMIASAIALVKPDLQACANASSAKGTIKVKVVVDATGSVTNVTILQGI